MPPSAWPWMRAGTSSSPTRITTGSGRSPPRERTIGPDHRMPWIGGGSGHDRPYPVHPVILSNFGPVIPSRSGGSMSPGQKSGRWVIGLWVAVLGGLVALAPPALAAEGIIFG